MELHIPKQKLH